MLFGGLSAPRAARRPTPVGVVTPEFLSVYDAYPRKHGKLKAAVLFEEMAAETPGGAKALALTILRAFQGGMLKRAPYAGDDRTRPILETVLADRMWEDAPSAPDNEPAAVRASGYREL